MVHDQHREHSENCHCNRDRRVTTCRPLRTVTNHRWLCSHQIFSFSRSIDNASTASLVPSARRGNKLSRGWSLFSVFRRRNGNRQPPPTHLGQERFIAPPVAIHQFRERHHGNASKGYGSKRDSYTDR